VVLLQSAMASSGSEVVEENQKKPSVEVARVGRCGCTAQVLTVMSKLRVWCGHELLVPVRAEAVAVLVAVLALWRLRLRWLAVQTPKTQPWSNTKAAYEWTWQRV
jgi:hypothetical protein